MLTPPPPPLSAPRLALHIFIGILILLIFQLAHVQLAFFLSSGLLTAHFDRQIDTLVKDWQCSRLIWVVKTHCTQSVKVDSVEGPVSLAVMFDWRLSSRYRQWTRVSWAQPSLFTLSILFMLSRFRKVRLRFSVPRGCTKESGNENWRMVCYLIVVTTEY